MKIFNLIITTKKKLKIEDTNTFEYAWTESAELHNRTAWAAINPVIHSLKELRNNTWDKERVDHAIEWLKENFVPEEK